MTLRAKLRVELISVAIFFEVFKAEHLNAAAALEAFAPDPWSREQLLEELECDAAYMFSAFDENGNLCGFCAFQAVCGEANLNAITVLPQMRGQGIGERLLRYAFENINATEVFLEVRCENHSAIRLYEKLGFVNCGRRVGFYKSPSDDALVMKLEI